MDEILTAASDTTLLLMVAWTVIVGSVGAGLGQSRAGRPVMGFFVSVLTPVPLLGWLLVIGLTHRTERVSPQGSEPSFFADLYE